jgi:hypothetical protein
MHAQYGVAEDAAQQNGAVRGGKAHDFDHHRFRHLQQRIGELNLAIVLDDGRAKDVAPARDRRQQPRFAQGSKIAISTAGRYLQRTGRLLNRPGGLCERK